MKRVLLITTAIDPKVMDAVKNIEESVRIDQLNQSLIKILYCLEDLSIKIYIIDGTGYDLRNKIDSEISENYDITTDYCIPCSENKTKSTAESYLLSFWSNKYQSEISGEDMVMKITGRYFISNLRRIIKALPDEFFYMTSISKNINLVQTVFFRTKFSRMQKIIKYLELNANNHEPFEKTVGDYIFNECKFNYKRVLMPVYIAQSGTSGKRHELNFKYRLIQIISRCRNLCIELV